MAEGRMGNKLDSSALKLCMTLEGRYIAGEMVMRLGRKLGTEPEGISSEYICQVERHSL